MWNCKQRPKPFCCQSSEHKTCLTNEKKDCGRTYCNWLHPPSYHTTASSLLRLAANSLKLHNMWIIAMFYQGIKKVWRKLSASCTSQWQNACINLDLVNTIKTSGPIKHFYEVKRQLYRFCTTAPKIYAVPFAAACTGTKDEGNLQSQERSVYTIRENSFKNESGYLHAN